MLFDTVWASGILATVFICVCGLWIPGILHAIWRQSLRVRCQALSDAGLTLERAAGPRLRIQGELDRVAVTAVLRGGLRGERLVLHRSGQTLREPLEQDALAQLRRLMAG